MHAYYTTGLFNLSFNIRRDRLSVVQEYQFSPTVFSNGKVQTRPPYAVEFQYSLQSCEFNFNVLPIHTIPDKSRIHTTREEINSLYNNMNDLLNFPCCTSKNVIIMGDFNQVPRYVLTKYRSSLDRATDVKEVEYSGSSSALTKDPRNQLDRYVQLLFPKIWLCQGAWQCMVLQVIDTS